MYRLIALLALLLPACLMAETKTITTSRYYYAFTSANTPIVRVQNDDRVIVKLPDAGGLDERGEKVAEPSNPLVGPIFVDGVEPGDAVQIKINRLKLTRNWGWSAYRLSLPALSPEYIEGIYPNRFKNDVVRPGRADLLRWQIDLEHKTVRLPEPLTQRFRLEFPAQPMLGCIGTAGPGNSAPSSTISGAWGGNLDYNAAAEGASVILPAFHPGGLVYIGDGHALQADGEPTGTGIETSMEVELEFSVVKRTPQFYVSLPRIETRDHLITIGSQPEFASSLDRALQMATTEMIHWLVDQWGAAPWEAHMMIGHNSKYEVVTVAGSMALRVPRSIIFQPPPTVRGQ